MIDVDDLVDCPIVDNCVTSRNYPRPYGNYEECKITIKQNVNVTCDAMAVECVIWDYLTINGGDRLCKCEHIPSSLSSGSIITWRSDSVVNYWKLCFTGKSSDQSCIVSQCINFGN